MRRFFTTIAVILLVAGPVVSQQRNQRAGRGGGAPGTPGSSTLERSGLKVGQAMPDITIHDAAGGDFRIADLKGKHTVVVFGCLT